MSEPTESQLNAAARAMADHTAVTGAVGPEAHDNNVWLYRSLLPFALPHLRLAAGAAPPTIPSEPSQPDDKPLSQFVEELRSAAPPRRETPDEDDLRNAAEVVQVCGLDAADGPRRRELLSLAERLRAALRAGEPREPSGEAIEAVLRDCEHCPLFYADGGEACDGMEGCNECLRLAAEAVARARPGKGMPPEPSEEGIDAFREECMRRGVGTRDDAKACLRAAYAVDFGSGAAPEETKP